MEMADISPESKKLSELEQIEHLSKDDLIVIEQNGTSYKMRYGQLLKIVAESIKAKLKSAAYHSAEEFAAFAHGHDYSDFDFFSSYKESLNTLKIGRFSIVKYLPGEDKQSPVKDVDVFQAKSFLPGSYNEAQDFLDQQRQPGDILLIAFNNPRTTFQQYLEICRGASIRDYGGRQNIDIYDNSFDGYVVPNGTTFTCESGDFREACLMFAGNASATSFTVPNLDSQFVKLCQRASLASLSPVPGQTGLVSHTHAIDTVHDSGKTVIDAGKMRFMLSLPPLKDVSLMKANTAYAHFIAGSTKKQQVPVVAKKVDVNGAITKAVIGDIVQQPIIEDDESYPTNNSIFALMYIGRR